MAMTPEEALAKRQQLCQDGFVSASRPAFESCLHDLPAPLNCAPLDAPLSAPP